MRRRFVTMPREILLQASASGLLAEIQHVPAQAPPRCREFRSKCHPRRWERGFRKVRVLYRQSGICVFQSILTDGKGFTSFPCCRYFTAVRGRAAKQVAGPGGASVRLRDQRSHARARCYRFHQQDVVGVQYHVIGPVPLFAAADQHAAALFAIRVRGNLNVENVAQNREGPSEAFQLAVIHAAPPDKQCERPPSPGAGWSIQPRRRRAAAV